MKLRRLAVPWAAAAGLALACAAPSPQTERIPVERVRPLESILPEAAIATEVAGVDFGTEPAREIFAEGWGTDESDAESTYVWSIGTASRLIVPLAAVREVQLDLDLEPLMVPGAPPQTIHIEWNGREADTLELRDGRARYRVKIDEELTRIGTNDLIFRYGRVSVPADHGLGDDLRPLAVRWYGLGFHGSSTADVPASHEDDAVLLPPGSSISFVVPPWSQATAFEIGAIDGDDRDTLTVVVERHDGREERRLRPSESLPPVALSEGDWSRLVLGVPPSKGDGVVLRGATLVRPIGSADTESTATDGADVDACVPFEPAVDTPPVVLYVVDTLRSDRLSIFGYRPDLTPRLGELAEDAIVFEHAIAQSSWTRSTVASILTGLYPSHHSVRGREDGLPRPVTTLAERFAETGYRTGGFTTNGNIGRGFGLGQGFEVYRHLMEKRKRRTVHVLADELNDFVFRWLDVGRAETPPRPVFLYVHATDPHAPYAPRLAWSEQWAPDVDPEAGSLEAMHAIRSDREAITPDELATQQALYEAEIAFTDQQLGYLLDRLHDLDLYDDAILVFVADHGEEFGDHGWIDHGRTLYEEQIHVPLVVKLPRGAHGGTRVPTPVAQIDVMPTVLEAAGLAPSPTDGQSLLPLATGCSPREPVPRAILSQLDLGDRTVRSVVQDGWKLIVERDQRALFRTTDRRELHDLATEEPFRVDYLAQLIRRGEAESALTEPGTTVEIPAEQLEMLEALGYVQ